MLDCSLQKVLDIYLISYTCAWDIQAIEMQQGQRPITFCGQVVGAEQLSLITEVSERYPNLSRTELANTVCELLGWHRANGRLKTVECRQWLERLQARR